MKSKQVSKNPLSNITLNDAEICKQIKAIHYLQTKASKNNTKKRNPNTLGQLELRRFRKCRSERKAHWKRKNVLSSKVRILRHQAGNKVHHKSSQKRYNTGASKVASNKIKRDVDRINKTHGDKYSIHI